jgi:hypothetical protein
VIGVGWRPELAADLLARPSAVGLVEVTAEGCASPEARREARAIAEVWPTAVHSIKGSLGSADGFDRDRVAKLARLARDVRATCISEHVAFVRSGGVDIGHLTGLPLTREAVAVVARNVDAARRLLPDLPLLLENVRGPSAGPATRWTKAISTARSPRRPATTCSSTTEISTPTRATRGATRRSCSLGIRSTASPCCTSPAAPRPAASTSTRTRTLSPTTS